MSWLEQAGREVHRKVVLSGAHRFIPKAIAVRWVDVDKDDKIRQTIQMSFGGKGFSSPGGTLNKCHWKRYVTFVGDVRYDQRH